jgi:lysylphosphatidylglycerol synthetase-like protein (DUF2156 family)
MGNIYRIKRSFVIPLVFIIILLFGLLLLSLFKGYMAERIILAVIFVTALFIGIESFKREIVVSEEKLTIKKFFRLKEFAYAEITHLAVVALKKKVYFLLTTTKGFYIFSNLFENHALLIRSLVDRLGEEKVEVEVRDYLNHPGERLALVIMSWIAVLVITVLLTLKLSGIYQ